MADPANPVEQGSRSRAAPAAGLRRSGYLSAALVSAAGLLLSQAAWFEEKFQAEAEEQAAAIERALAGNELVLDALRRFYAGSQEVEPDEFYTFVEPYFGRVPGLELLGWVPWTGLPLEATRPELIPAQRGRLDLSPAAAQSSMGARAGTLRLQLGLPKSRAEQLKALDLGELPEVHKCLLQAAARGESVMSGRTILPGDQPGETDVFLAAPVYRDQPPQDPAQWSSLRGWVVAEVEIGPLVHDALGHLKSDLEIQAWVIDSPEGQPPHVLAVWPQQTEAPSLPSSISGMRMPVHARTIVAGPHKLQVVCTPADERYMLWAGWRSWVVRRQTSDTCYGPGGDPGWYWPWDWRSAALWASISGAGPGKQPGWLPPTTSLNKHTRSWFTRFPSVAQSSIAWQP